jgi:hypothetical protein
MSEKSVRMGAKLYQCRDTARTVLGQKYAERMTVYGLGIQAIADKEKVGTIAAAVELCKKTDTPMEAIFVLAEAVEMIEPSAGDTAKTRRGETCGT